MDLGDKTGMTLDEIIKMDNIQGPPKSTSSVSRRISHPFNRRGGGFAGLAAPRPSPTGHLMSADAIFESAFQAGMAAALNLRPRGGFHAARGRFHGPRHGFPRQQTTPGGLMHQPIEEEGFLHQPINEEGFLHQATAEQRFPYLSPSPKVWHSGTGRERMVGGRGGSGMQLQRRGIQRGWISGGGFPRKDVKSDLLRITVAGGRAEGGRPALRDRLGWLPGQALTPAQQVARNKLALAKSRLGGFLGCQRYATRAFVTGVVAARQERISAARLPRHWPNRAETGNVLDTGVSPLLRQNVALLPGPQGSSGARSARSGRSGRSGRTAHSFLSTQSVRSRNKLQNKAYRAERQFDWPEGAAPSMEALRERMRPTSRWGSHNRPHVHRPRLDVQLQTEIDSLQMTAPPPPPRQPHEFEYRAPVAPTQTSTTARFGLMMSL